MFQSGTKWSYSSAVDIQGYIVEKLSGQKFGEFIQQLIFKPLKMTDTAFYVSRDKADRLAAVYVGNQKTGKLEEAKQLFGVDMPTTSSLRRWSLAAVGSWALSATTPDSPR